MITSDIMIILKFIFINICTYYVITKITAEKYNKITKVTMGITCIIIAILYALLVQTLNLLFTITLSYSLFALVLSIVSRKQLGHVISLTIIALTISFVLHFISIMVVALFFGIMNLQDASDKKRIIDILSHGTLQLIFTYYFFKIRRFKSGFQFLQTTTKKYESITFGIIAIIGVILTFYLIPLYYESINSEKRIYLLGSIVIIIICIINWILKELKSYYRIQQMKYALDMQDREIEEKDIKISKLSEENCTLGKIIHETNNQLKAMELLLVKRDNLNFNEEYAEDNGVLDAVKKLKSEFRKKLDENMKTDNTLPKTKIIAIDSMFDYMLQEAKNNNIELNLNIKGSIDHMIEKYIEQDKLEILIGDLIKNAIIAINSSNIKQRQILVLFGKITDNYGISIFDTGIDFKIDTLLNLGLIRSTTHADNGGSGIGFMTTFETLRKCKASIIIEEKKLKSVGYTKSITILFDNKNKYRIKSYRAKEIREQNSSRKIIIEDLR